MSTLAVIAVVVGALVFVGMLQELIPSILRGRADLELARNGAGGYSASVVQIAVRGALIVADVDPDAADRQAELILDELETKGVVFDGRDWLPIVR
jgi:hypothetical protein